MSEKNFEIKAYTKAELSIKYGISRVTLKVWFKRINEKIKTFEPAENSKHILTPQEVKIFVDYVGYP